MKNKLTLFLLCATAIIASCQNKQEKLKSKQMEERFEWSPGVGAAHLYPMELYRCTYIYADGDGVGPAPPNLTDGVWGEQNGASVVGEVMKPVPVALDITWLSYTENKFYKGHFKLPYEKILKLFQHGYQSLLEKDGGGVHFVKENYDSINAGLAPGGIVVVWLIGGQFTTEVGRFQATETKIEMKDFAPEAWTRDQKTYVTGMMEDDKAVTTNLAKNGIPFGMWDRYRERFNQRAVVKFDQKGNVALDNVTIKYYNGEREIEYSEKWKKNEFRERARIREMHLGWNGVLANKPQYFVLNILFNESEMFKAYSEAFGDNPQQEGQVVVEINRGNDRYKAFLQVGDNKIELVKQQGEIMYNNTNK